MSIIKNMENWMILFLGLFIFGFFVEGPTSIKYIGLYGSLLFFILKIEKQEINYYLNYYKNNNLLLISFFLFILIILISILFSYSDIQPSIKEFRVEFLNIGIFMLISLGIKNVKLLIKVLLFSLIIAFLFNTIRYGYNYYLNSHFDFSIRLKRNYCDYFEILYPFILGFIFILKNKIRYLLSFTLIIALFELLLTGTRGSWVSVIFETIIFLGFISLIYKQYLTKIVISSGIFVVLLLGIGNYLYNHSSLFKNKIHQGLKPSGRDFIIKTRLPIFLKHSNLLIGVGGVGGYQYIKFLNDYNAPKKYGHSCGSYYNYAGDEPYLLQIFYKNGVLGLLMFLALIFIFLKEMILFIMNNKNLILNRIFVLGIMSSFIGSYLIRGLVEGRDLKYLIIYLVLFILVKEINLKKETI